MSDHARLRALVLGASAGGGFPQWNCNCSNCVAVRGGNPAFEARTQSSIAVSADGETWALVNASPDLNAQLKASPALQPASPDVAGLRASPLKAVLVTNGDIDHIAGLLSMREAQPFTLFATAEIHRIIAENPVFQALAPHLVPRVAVRLDEPFELVAGVTARLFPVPGKVPLYLEGETVDTGLVGEQTAGVEFAGRDGARFFYIPGCAHLNDSLRTRLHGADLVLFDGTVYHDDEMARAGVGPKTGTRMGHLHMAGQGGTLDVFNSLAIARKIFIHINNTNPVLDARSAERAAIAAAGWSLARDGMELTL